MGVTGQEGMVLEGGAHVLEEWVYDGPWAGPKLGSPAFQGGSDRLGSGSASSTAPDLTLASIICSNTFFLSKVILYSKVSPIIYCISIVAGWFSPFQRILKSRIVKILSKNHRGLTDDLVSSSPHLGTMCLKNFYLEEKQRGWGSYIQGRLLTNPW